jgi:hypothetical protein
LGIRRIALVAGALVALASCDMLFDLDHVGARSDAAASGDGANGDGVTADALCVPAGHDEDTDDLDDACDPCPTFASPMTAVDDDLDGLPNECDRNNAANGTDKILAYWTFGQEGFEGFSVSGDFMYTQINNGMYAIQGTSMVTTTSSYPLTRVDFHVSGITMAGYPSELQLQIGTNTLCTFHGAACGGSGTGTCITFGTSATGTWAMPSSAARRVSLFREGSAVTCEITDGVNGNAVGANTALIPGTVGFAMNATAGLELEAIVIYGAK